MDGGPVHIVLVFPFPTWSQFLVSPSLKCHTDQRSYHILICFSVQVPHRNASGPSDGQKVSTLLEGPEQLFSVLLKESIFGTCILRRLVNHVLELSSIWLFFFLVLCCVRWCLFPILPALCLRDWTSEGHRIDNDLQAQFVRS